MTLGILHLVGGGLGLLLSGCNVIGLLAMRGGLFPNQGPNPALEVRNELAHTVPGYTAVQYGTVGISLVLDILLITFGIGLLFQKQWARIGSMVYAVLSILTKVVLGTYQLALVWPAASNFADGMAPQERAGFQVGFFGAVCIEGAFIVYPIVVLILLNLPGVKKAFNQPIGRADPEDDFDRRDSRSRYDDDDRYDDR